jgi:DNA-directed RNA polymerase subunit L
MNKKIEIDYSEKNPNEIKVILKKEDKTLGNLISKTLIKDDSVHYVGDHKNHPFDDNIIIKVISKSKEHDPKKLLYKSLSNIIHKLKLLKDEFKTSIATYKSSFMSDI